jgi:uncharacterized protein YozE (UPF0346 family)
MAMTYYNIPDIYTLEFAGDKKYITLNIEDINIQKSDMSKRIIKNYNINTDIMIVQSSVFGFLDNTIPIINNYIYFPYKYQQKIYFFIQSYNYDEIFLEINNITVLHKKYKIYICNDLQSYCSGDENLILINTKYNFCTFNIYIELRDPDTEILIKNKDITHKIIKTVSNNYIFHFKVYKINKRYINLQLYGITNIINDKTLLIDIKFDNVNYIYSKYEKAYEDISTFLEKNKKYVIIMSDFESKIKGTYYMDCLSFSKN